ncbi:hypothetical protein CYMTET_20820 [Cymbomonas tetramitiformis]|uniref:Uncharacterized protein n=1 Tax=Cymbomonas tetramitiformis TaxID=36881 RepID=A0AAE0G3A2_9CHLO|nr:hypothetical protein CYMTET_20820 [Cymbomonas tetramitiformis]
MPGAGARADALTGSGEKGAAEGFNPLAERSESDSELAPAAGAGASGDARFRRAGCRSAELNASSDTGSAPLTLAGEGVFGGEALGGPPDNPGGDLRGVRAGVTSRASPPYWRASARRTPPPLTGAPIPAVRPASRAPELRRARADRQARSARSRLPGPHG